MQILEDRIPFRTGQLVDVGDRGLGVAGAVAGPARQQRRDQIGDRPADRLVDVELRGRIFLQLEIAHADHQPGDAIGLVDRQDAVGELDGLVDIAVGERGDEGAIEQFVVLRIGAKRRAIERRRRIGVALHAGMAGGQIAAGRGQRFQIVAGREIAPSCRPDDRASAPDSEPGTASAATAKAAIVQRLKRMENITVRLAPGFTAGFTDRSRMRTQPAASSRATMPRLAFNRKDTGWRIDWQQGPDGRRFRQPGLKTLSVWRYRGRRPALTQRAGSRNRGHIAS